eukprot:11814098-Alexandrium_andersonii.AAC.1
MAKNPPARVKARASRSAALRRALPRSTDACSEGVRSARPHGCSTERAGRGPGVRRLKRATLHVEHGGPAS